MKDDRTGKDGKKEKKKDDGINEDGRKTEGQT